MSVNNPDRAPVGIYRRDTAPTPTGFAQIVGNDFHAPTPQKLNDVKLSAPTFNLVAKSGVGIQIEPLKSWNHEKPKPLAILRCFPSNCLGSARNRLQVARNNSRSRKIIKVGATMRNFLLFLVILLLIIGVASGQNTPQPKKIERVQYYKVEYHKFKPGKADEGRSFIRKYFRPADRAAGIEVLEFTPVTGDWDWIAFFPVEADFLVWERSPMSLRARAKFEEMVGGTENAKKLDKEFFDLIQELKIEIMMRDLEK